MSFRSDLYDIDRGCIPDLFNKDLEASDFYIQVISAEKIDHPDFGFTRWEINDGLHRNNNVAYFGFDIDLKPLTILKG